MSLGYVKGKYWVSDDRYKAWTLTPTYTALIAACRKAGMTFECSYSYTSRMYYAEVVTLERFTHSAHWYQIKHTNAYDAHPMAAISLAIRKYERATPLLLAVCLELECLILKDAIVAARKREAVEAKLHAALDMLAAALDSVPDNTLFNRMAATRYVEEPYHVIAAREIGDCYDEDDDL